LFDRTAIDALPTKDGSSADTTHVASSIIPPTNSWLSGMVLQKTPKPVYPMPLSFLAKESGFEVGLPTITVDATTIAGGHTPGIDATIGQATHFQMTRYDKISTSLTYKDSQDAKISTVTLAEGVPYVYYRAQISGDITLKDITPSQSGKNSSKYLRYTKAGHDYVVLADADSTITVHDTTAILKLSKDSLVTFYALPDKGNDTLREFAGNELASVDTEQDVSDKAAITTLRYNTINNRPTVYAAMGYTKTAQNGRALATYQNIYGQMKAVAGNKLMMTAPIAAESNQLAISDLSAEHRQSLIKTLENDVTKTKISAQDSYYAGKQLARAANLLDTAMQLNQSDTATRLKTIIKDEMTSRLDSDYFYYDSKIKGVAADTKAFGSEDFNDHHFHYGNFIYAASILGRYDKQFLNNYQDKVNLLVADIASYDKSDYFPVQRNYDAYAGHSWAAGLAPFADGNNQESSSEAMNAWNAVALWGALIGNATLAETGSWMLSNESATARNVWRTPPVAVPNGSNYTSPVTSLNFGGKLTYSTFFSDQPNAKLGIQLISMNPFMTELSRDDTRIKKLVDASITNDNFNVALADYILMYLSLYDAERALGLAGKQQDAFIDDGNSRTYLNAFIYNQLDT
jgi:endoglucanase Acf2